MKKPFSARTACWMALWIVTLVVGRGHAAAPDPAVAALWQDPVFQKQFVGAYGINAEVEPRVTPEEIGILEKLQPLMGTDLAKAEALLAKQVRPESSAILDFTLGSIHFQQDKLTAALDCYRKAVAKFPSFRRAWRNLGLIYVRDGTYADAISAFTRMIELGGGDPYSYGLLGFSHAAQQDYLAAEAAYRNALLLQPDNTEWRLGLTRCVLKQQKYEDAVTLLDVLIARYPDKAEFWLLQANAYLGTKQPLKAAENLECVDRLGKSSVDSLNTLGDIYVNETLFDLATSAYARAIQRDPQQPASRALRAVEVLAARGALEAARTLTAQIHRTWNQTLDEADRRRLLKLEARLAMAEGAGSADSVKVLEELIQLDPLDGDALMLLGLHYSRVNEPDRAIFYYERAQSLEAFEPNAKLRHAQVLVGLGRYADALPLLRRVQELKPRDDVARYLEQVERIAKTRR